MKATHMAKKIGRRGHRLLEIGKHFSSFRVLVLLLLVFLALFLVFNLLWLNRILPNTRIGDYNFGGKNSIAAETLVSQLLDNYQSSILTFEINGQITTLPFSSFGVKLDKSATLSRLNENRFTSPADIFKLISAIFSERKVNTAYEVDFGTMDAVISEKFLNLGGGAQNATIVAEGAEFKIKEGQNGLVIDKSDLLLSLKDRIDNVSNQQVNLSFTVETPEIMSAQLQKALVRLQKLQGQTFVFNYGFDSWSLKNTDIADLTTIDLPTNAGGYSFYLGLGPGVYVKNYSNTNVEDAQLLLDSAKIDTFFVQIGKAIDRPKVDATLQFENGRVQQFTPAIDGLALDRESIKNQLTDKLSTNELTNNKLITFKLPVIVTRAKVANEQINALGISELVGRGVSYFAGSIPNRMHNVQLGASRINGVLVAPGEIFSFNKSVGEVSGATGYKQAYVISAGRTVLDDGGGICQISTTVFRAALNAGLPIVSRTGHAYRVGYYEQRGFKPGLDATVYSPSVDFTFKNDTDHHLLVQTVYDPVNARLEVDFYGTLDGRRVVQSEPVVTNVTPAPPEKREDDPTLPKGTVKQVDFAASGANVYFTRKVFKGERLVIDDVFKTNYRPWQAIFLVGTAG